MIFLKKKTKKKMKFLILRKKLTKKAKDLSIERIGAVVA